MRHVQRHAEASIVTWLTDVLDDAGWLKTLAADRPYGVGPTTISATLTGISGTDPGGSIVQGTTSPLVGVVLLGQETDVELELGGALAESGSNLFITIVAQPSIASAMADDVMDAVAGRRRPPFVTLVDQAAPSTPTGEKLELVEARSEVMRPERRDVHVVSARVVRCFARDWT